MTLESVSLEHLLQLNNLWVFGYGSLIWNPGFKYTEDLIGYVEDFSRKFWQGNITHRGRPGKPGRVVTLTEEKGARVWGRAFHIVGADQVVHCLEQLGIRECVLGGYEVQMTDFTLYKDQNQLHHSSNKVPLGCRSERLDCILSKSQDISKSPKKSQTIKTLTFIALPENDLFLGPAMTSEMAECLLQSEGPNGRNLDYMLGILEFLRFNVPLEELIFEQEILHIERDIWNRLLQDGFEAVADCHGFYLEKNTELNDPSLDRIRKRDCLFSPLLDSIRRIEVERTRHDNNMAVVGDVPDLLESLTDPDQASDDESDSLLSSSLPSNSSFDDLEVDQRRDFSESSDDDSDYTSS